MKVIKGFFKFIGTLMLIGILAGLIFSCIFAVYVKTYLRSQIDFSMEDISLDQTSVIYYWDGETGSYKELQKIYGKQNRTWVDFNEIPADLRDLAEEYRRLIPKELQPLCGEECFHRLRVRGFAVE